MNVYDKLKTFFRKNIFFDENIYEKILCKKTSDNVNNDHEQMNVEFFIN